MFNFLKKIGGPLGWLLNLLLAPLRLLGFGGGGGGPRPLDLPKAPAAPKLATPTRVAGDLPERKMEMAQETRAVKSWIMSTLAAGNHAAMPPRLARDVKQWLPGLTTRELEKLLGAGLEGIGDHIHGKRPVEGIPSVRPLPLAAIEPSARRVRPAEIELNAEIEQALSMCA